MNSFVACIAFTIKLMSGRLGNSCKSVTIGDGVSCFGSNGGIIKQA